jgi:asparagine synthase (glutamine-hydrolysing)
VSGIAGIIHFDGRPEARAALDRMLRALAELGPDREASWHDGAVALGVRQMTLLPEDRFDRQPWRAHDGALVMVADARIDNRGELARALALGAEDERTASDSELLLKAYERWGVAGLDRIVGEFTFAAWDAREQRLVCARSQLGGAPLYYYRGERFFAFASTARALFTLPEVERTLDERRLACALALLPGPASDTFYRNVHCLPPAHCLSVTRGSVTLERYWRLDVTRRITLASDGDYAAALRERFERAVGAQLRSIHPVGAHLSAGCDSSAVTAVAARLLQPAGQGLAAFTAAPREGYAERVLNGRIADESPLAAQLAASLANVSHVVVRPNGVTPFDRIDRGNLLYGRPVQSTANLGWIEQILDAARERRVRVLLTGTGGNMTISYGGMPHLAGLLRRGRWLAFAREAASLARRGMGPRTLVDVALGPFMPVPLWRWWRGLADQHASGLHAHSAINPALAAELGLERIAQDMGRDLSHRPPADGRDARRAYFEANDGGDYRDGIRAGWGIETRDPAIDRRVVEFCLAIPEDQFLRRGEVKLLYRRAFEPVFPAAEIVARKRGYQAADWHEDLTAARAQVATELDRLERSAGARRALDLPRLRRLVENWPTGNWHREDITQQYRLMLMRGVAVGMFIRAVEGGNE